MSAQGVIGIFRDFEATVRAVRAAQGQGLGDLTVWSPLREEEIEEAVGGPLSRVRYYTLAGGILGAVSGFALTIGTSLEWNLVVSGKPIISIPPFIIIAYELTILGGALATVLGLLIHGRLPRLRRAAGYDPRFSEDRFGVRIGCPRERVAAAQEVLRGAGAEEVHLETG